MKLIINADDYGSSRGINFGIIDAYKRGIVTSTTMLVNTDSFEHGIELLKDNEGLGIGVHLALTISAPVSSNLKTIVNEDGQFYKLKELEQIYSRFSEYEIEQEYRAQIEKLLNTGIKITHLDSHHHTHMLMPMFKVVTKLAKEYKVPIRVSDKLRNSEYMNGILTTEALELNFYDKGVTLENFKNIIKKYIKYESLEIMCHPAYLDNNIYTTSSYNINRIKELEVLTSKEIKSFISRDNNICLCNFSDL